MYDSFWLLKIIVFETKSDYDVIIFVHGVIQKNLPYGSNCIVDVPIWPKFDNKKRSWDSW